MKKDFYEKGLFAISNYIFSFFQNTLSFIVCNLPLILFLIITSKYKDSFNLLILFICLLPFGPALSALYYSTSKLITDKDIFFSSFFWNYYKKNFKNFFKIWALYLSIIFILIYDFQFFYMNFDTKYIHFVFLALILIIISISFYTLCISSLFNFKFKDIIILSVLYAFKKFPIVLMKFVAIFVSYCLCNNVSILLLPFMPSIICIVFFCYDKNTVREITTRFTLS